MTENDQFVRGLSLLDSVLLLAGGIIGSGIFLTARDVAANTRFPALFLAIWVIGMAVTMLACFAFAELGAMFPQAGGQYVYIREAYGELAAFLYGWMIFTVSVTGTAAALGAGFAEYFGGVFPALSAGREVMTLGGFTLTRGHLVAVAAVALQTVVNIFGVRWGVILQNAATWAKFAAIGAFLLLGLAWGRGSWTHYSTAHTISSSGSLSAAGLGVALIAVFWAYDGWVYITWVAGEVREPRRNLPRSLALGVGLVGVVYLAMTAVYLYALPMEEIASQTAVAQAAAVAMFSPGAARWLALTIALSCFGAMSAALMSGARVYYAMAADGVFFPALARIHPRWRTPVGSLILQGVWAAALALSGRYDQLFTYVMFMMVLSYVLTVLAVFVLRRKRPDASRPYRCAGYPWVPALYVLFGGAWAVNAVVERPRETLAGTALVLLGLPLYFYWRRLSRRKSGSARAPRDASDA